MAAFVVCNPFFVGAAQEERALGAEDDLFQRVEKVLWSDLLLLSAGGQQRRFIDQVSQIRSRETRSRGGYLL